MSNGTSKKNTKNHKTKVVKRGTTATKKKQSLKAKAPTKKSNNKRNNHNPTNNVRLKKRADDVDFVPFLDGQNDVEEITPNRIRKVRPDNYQESSENNTNEIKIKPIVVLEITFFIGIIMVIGYLAFNLELFNLEKITINGNEKYTDEQILQNCNLTLGENVFKQLILKSREIESLSYISDVSYSYSFPSTITVKVKERFTAYIAYDSNTKKYYKIDNDGYLLEECDPTKIKDALLVEGIVLEANPKMGEKINEVYLEKLERYNTIKKLLDEYGITGNTSKVQFINSLTTITLDDKLKIIFGNDSNYEYKVSFLKTIIDKNGGNLEGKIDMSIENPVYSEYE